MADHRFLVGKVFLRFPNKNLPENCTSIWWIFMLQIFGNGAPESSLLIGRIRWKSKTKTLKCVFWSENWTAAILLPQSLASIVETLLVSELVNRQAILKNNDISETLMTSRHVATISRTSLSVRWKLPENIWLSHDSKPFKLFRRFYNLNIHDTLVGMKL